MSGASGKNYQKRHDHKGCTKYVPVRYHSNCCLSGATPGLFFVSDIVDCSNAIFCKMFCEQNLTYTLSSVYTLVVAVTSYGMRNVSRTELALLQA